MTREADAQFLQALICGDTDPLAPSALGRMSVLGAQYRGRGDATLTGLLAQARDVHDEAVDRAYLIELIEGRGDLLSESTYPNACEMLEKYCEGSDMYVLLEKVANMFSDAAQEAATWALAGEVIALARDSNED